MDIRPFLCFLVVAGVALGIFIPVAVPDIQRKRQYRAGTCVTRTTNSTLSLGREIGPCSNKMYCSGLPCDTFPITLPGTFFCCGKSGGCQIQIVPGILYTTEISFQGSNIKVQTDQFCLLANPNCVIVSQSCFTNGVDIRFDAYTLSPLTIFVIVLFSLACMPMTGLGCLSLMICLEANKKNYDFDKSEVSSTGKIGQLVPLSEIKNEKFWKSQKASWKFFDSYIFCPPRSTFIFH